MLDDFEFQRLQYLAAKNADYEAKAKSILYKPPTNIEAENSSNISNKRAERVQLLNTSESRPNPQFSRYSFTAWMSSCSNCLRRLLCSCESSSCWERFEDGNFRLARIPFKTGIFAVNSVPVYIHPFWWFFWVLSILSGWQSSALYAFFLSIITGPVLLVTVIIHELGHAAMAVHRGGSVDKVLIWPLGGLAFIDSTNYDGEPISDALVAIAGPLTHIPQVLVWSLLMLICSRGQVGFEWSLSWGLDFLISVCAAAISMQFALFFFNLLPAYPLDGGRILSAMLTYRGWQKAHVMRITALVGGFVGSYLFFSALTTMFITEQASSSFTFVPFNLGGNSTLLLISLFIISSCNTLWVRAAQEEIIAQQRPFPVAGDPFARSGNAFPARNRGPFASYISPPTVSTHPQQYGSVGSSDPAEAPKGISSQKQKPNVLGKKVVYSLSDV